ncbi:Gfo/Idh/MocA family protein [Saccharothrix isguenensis]
MSDCRIGFIGAGGVALRHARMLTGLPDAAVVAVTDPLVDRAAQFAAEFGAKDVADVPELLALGLDAVYVCVPPFAHGPVEEAVIAAGVPMFVEKPLGLDLEVADRIAAAVAERGLLTSVGHHWRYATPLRHAARVLADRQVRLVTGSWLDEVPPVSWWTRRDRSGGQVVEQAVHVLDVARLLAGEVVEVHAMADGVAPPGDAPGDLDRATAAVLRFASGAVGSLAATCLLRRKHRAGLEVCADGLVVTLAEDGAVVRLDDGEPWRLEVDPDAAKRMADKAFVDAVMGRPTEPLVPYEDAYRTHRLACLIAESAATRRPVRVTPDG